MSLTICNKGKVRGSREWHDTVLGVVHLKGKKKKKRPKWERHKKHLSLGVTKKREKNRSGGQSATRPALQSGICVAGKSRGGGHHSIYSC